MRTMQSELAKKGISKKGSKQQNKPKKHKEKYSRREIEELMGTHRPTYHRVNGAIRSK